MRGKAFEQDIVDLAASYEKARVLVLRKVDPPVRMLGQRVLFLRNPFLDFAGSLTSRNGKAIFVEAKETSDGKLAIKSQNGVTAHQWHMLRVWNCANAITAVVWHAKPRVYFLPVDWIQACLTRCERMHIKETDVPRKFLARKGDWIKIMLDLLPIWA